jgi:hypothetical protein
MTLTFGPRLAVMLLGRFFCSEFPAGKLADFPRSYYWAFWLYQFPPQAETFTVDEQIGFSACCAGCATK